MGKVIYEEGNHQEVQGYAGIHQPGKGGQGEFNDPVYQEENFIIQTKQYAETKGIVTEFIQVQ